ncbi:hypothetical protein F4818DRAFT_417277 [Hypoxylon cercidicola]|nr:hypothetical protein F4818DRAFT_417277 [Hypoxylon cercidicola]
MLLFLLEAVLTIALLAAPSCAAPQDDWIFPANPDQTSSLVTGEKYTLKWNSNLKTWFAQYCDACDTQNVDLWILGGNNFHKLSSGINVETTLSYTWTADIPFSELNVDLWVFRFLASGVKFEGTETQSIASPIFFLREGDGNSETTVGQTSTTKAAGNPTVAAVSTGVEKITKTNVVEVTKTNEETVETVAAISETSVAIKATSTASPNTSADTTVQTSPKSTSITASSSLPASSTSPALDSLITASATDITLPPHGTASPNSKDTSSSSGLSKAAMIGIGVGIAVGSAALCCLVWFFCLQRRRRGILPLAGSPMEVPELLQPEAAAAAMPGTWIYDRRTAMAKELQGDEAGAELEHMPLAELPASPVAAELPIRGYSHGR